MKKVFVWLNASLQDGRSEVCSWTFELKVTWFLFWWCSQDTDTHPSSSDLSSLIRELYELDSRFLQKSLLLRLWALFFTCFLDNSGLVFCIHRPCCNVTHISDWNEIFRERERERMWGGTWFYSWRNDWMVKWCVCLIGGWHQKKRKVLSEIMNLYVLNPLETV